MPSPEDRWALLSLAACPSFGYKKIKIFTENFFPLASCFQTNHHALALLGFKGKDIETFLSWRKNFSLSQLRECLDKNSINFSTWQDHDYPPRLLEIPDPPPLVFYRGDLSLLSRKSIKFLAVVGARQPTVYAERVAEELLSAEIVKEIVVVSGLAIGVDALAHQQALAGDGKTVAVLGSGLLSKVIYPRSNRFLVEKIIASGGLILSEFLPDCPPKKENFPRRNRLISGLSQAVLIIEAKERSGSLITARHALEQGRDVWVVPGNIFSSASSGTNKLLQAGAWPILSAADMLDTLGIDNLELNNNLKNGKAGFIKKTKYCSKYKPKNQAEKEVIRLISDACARGEKIDAEKITRLSSLDTSVINSTLTILELAGAIKEKAGLFEPSQSI